MDFVSSLRRALLVAVLTIAVGVAFILLAPTFLRDVQRELGWRDTLTRPPVTALNRYLFECGDCEHTVEARVLLDRTQRDSGLVARLDVAGGGDQRRREQVAVAVLSGDERLVATTGTRDLTLWDAGSGARLRDLALRDFGDGETYGLHAKAIAAAPDAQRIALLSDNGAIWLWDTATGIPTTRLSLGIPNAERLAFAPGGRGLLWFAPGAVGVADLEQRTARPLAHPDVDAAGYAADGTLVTVSRAAILRWPAGGGAPLGSTAIETYATPLAVSADGSRVFFGTGDTLEVWDVGTGTRLWMLGPHAGDVRDACDAGGRVVVGTDEGTLHVWDEASGREIARQRAHPSRVDRLHCGRGGTQVLTLGLYAREAKLWSVDRLAAAGRFEGPEQISGEIDVRRPERSYDRLVVAVADSAMSTEVPRLVAFLDAFEEDLTVAAFIGFGLILGGFALRSWLR